MDTTVFIQSIALFFFGVCFYDAYKTDGARAAQQWFIVGYLYALLRENLLVGLNQIQYSASMIFFGGAPSLTSLLIPALLYVAYVIARRFANPDRLGSLAYLMFLILPVLFLPLDAAALEFQWWSYPSESQTFLNGIPYYVPFAWGISAALFYLFVGRIRKIRFRGNGQLFLMIVVIPILVIINVLLIAVLQLAVSIAFGLGGTGLLDAALGILFLALPLALVVNLPRLGETSA